MKSAKTKCDTERTLPERRAMKTSLRFSVALAIHDRIASKCGKRTLRMSTVAVAQHPRASKTTSTALDANAVYGTCKEIPSTASDIVRILLDSHPPLQAYKVRW